MALCRTTFLPVTRFGGHMDVNLSQFTTLNVSDDLKLSTNTTTVHPYFYPFTTGFTRRNDGWMGLCIKLWEPLV